MSRKIDDLISCWSMRPPPQSIHGQAWEDGARQGWWWAQDEIERLNAIIAGYIPASDVDPTAGIAP